MNFRLHNAKTFAVKRSFETLLSPAFYILITFGIVTVLYLVPEFIKTIESDGVNYSKSLIYNMTTTSFSGLFGENFTDVLFAEGPYLFTFYIAFVPFMLYLVISSVFKFGHEQSTGALELLTCGPVDTTAIFSGHLIRDFLFSLAYQVLLLLLFFISSLLTNLALGPMFYANWFFLIFFSLAIFTFGALSSVIANNAVSATGIFCGIILILVAVQLGTMMVVDGYARDIAGLLTLIIQWISPLFYWSIGISSNAGPGVYAGSIFILLLLSAIILFISHLIARKKGVGA